MPKKPKLTEAEVRARILTQAKSRIGCEDFVPTFTLRRAEPDTSGRWTRANWDASPGQGAEAWPRDGSEAFREAVERNRGKYDVDWQSTGAGTGVGLGGPVDQDVLVNGCPANCPADRIVPGRTGPYTEGFSAPRKSLLLLLK